MMKKVMFFLGALTALVSCGGEKNPALPKFLHATYSVQELLTREEVDRPDYGTFDMIYLMAMPSGWASLDFDAPREAMVARADSFDYASAGEPVSLVPEMIAKVHEAGSRILLCCGGQQEFVQFNERPERLRRLADYLVRLVERNGYDGLDIDWEITLDKELHIGLVSDLRRQLDSLSALNGRTYYVTSALSIDHVYDADQAARLSAVLDWVNIMSYDMCDGVWGTTPSHNTSMVKLQEKLGNWVHFKPEKLCLGLANYGFHYRGLLPGQTAEGPLSDCGRYITYREFLPMLEQDDWTEQYDEEAEVSYFFAPDSSEFVTIEKPETIRRKIEWITGQPFRGVFWWEYHHDRLLDRAPADGPISHALIEVVAEYLAAKSNL